MKTLVTPAILVLTLSLAPVVAVAGDNPVNQPVPGLSQEVSDTQLDQFKGKVSDPADLSQTSRTVPTTQKVAEDTINFSENVIATMKGYNTHPPNSPAIGPSGPIGPSGGIGPTWARGGNDITMHNR
jgi:hypothetical protein